MHHPIPAVIAILQHDDRFLLVRRRNEPDAGLWGHAGGKVEWGEDLDAAALRELREETGIRAEVAGRLAPLDCLSGTAPEHHFILCPVVCRYQAGDPVAGDDADAVGWFSLAAMRRDPARFSRDVIGICEQAQAV
ncbi:NUDIX hydrolase [Marinobacter sp. JSM 1782161]|uniref:NUDIX hydrolase n=1 Tax=Marinobacter sp. JSM 1782161 TaxID=2685906 RepID=UPI0014029911|nr:NUDIX hydrolase [Marinobacter sp. JSM 1782161]